MALHLVVDTNRVPTSAFIDQVEQWAGEQPSVLIGYEGRGGGAAARMTPAGVQAVHDKNMALGLVFNNIVRTQMAMIGDGTIAAKEAVQRGVAISYPAGCTIIGDVEAGWPLTTNFAEDWIQTIIDAGYSPGLYAGYSRPLVHRAIAGVRSSLLDHLVRWDARWLFSHPWTAHAGKRISFPPWNEQPGVAMWQFSGASDADRIDLSMLDTPATPQPVFWMPPGHLVLRNRPVASSGDALAAQLRSAAATIDAVAAKLP